MNYTKLKYTEDEVLEIFKEQHRLCSPLDPEADPSAEISSEMTIKEWRWANDLLSWKKLSEFLNQEFRINVGHQEWKDVLEPARKKKLKGVCSLISEHAEKDNIEPIRLFGQPCIKASVFLTLKQNLKNKGVDTSELKPSSEIGFYIDKYSSPMLEEITLTGTKPIDEIDIRAKKKGFWNAINLLDKDRFETLTGDIKTFRDLIEKIVEEREKTEPNRVARPTSKR